MDKNLSIYIRKKFTTLQFHIMQDSGIKLRQIRNNLYKHGGKANLIPKEYPIFNSTLRMNCLSRTGEIKTFLKCSYGNYWKININHFFKIRNLNKESKRLWMNLQGSKTKTEILKI